MTLGEQPLAQNPRTILMGLPDLPFMQGGLQRTPGLHLPKMPTPADRSADSSSTTLALVKSSPTSTHADWLTESHRCAESL